KTAARTMSGSPGTGGSNPRKFSEKIALHNQKQAEETRAFEQLMTDLNVSRVQFQKIQQLRLSQSRAPYYGGSLPNVNQIGKANEFQGGFPSGLDSVRGTRHHGLVERVHRDRNRINSPHRRPAEHVDSSPYGGVYLSPPLDNNWRREQQPWTEEKRPGFRLISQLNRTNSDSALHTSALNPNPQNPFVSPVPFRGCSESERGGGGRLRERFPPLVGEESLLGVSKPLPKQLWEAKKVQSLASRPKSCEVPGINIFPSPEQNPGLCHYQGLLNTGGSLPDLSNLHFPSPLSTPLDPEDNGAYPNLSGGSSTGNLPAAMMHLGIGGSQGGQEYNDPVKNLDYWMTCSSPDASAFGNDLWATVRFRCDFVRKSRSHRKAPRVPHQLLIRGSVRSLVLSCPMRFSSARRPSTTASYSRHSAIPPSTPPLRLSNSSPRRRPAPISPLTLSPGSEQRRGLSKQLSPTMSPSLSPITQGVALDTSNMPREPPPPYPLYPQSQHAVDQSRHLAPPEHLVGLQQQSDAKQHGDNLQRPLHGAAVHQPAEQNAAVPGRRAPTVSGLGQVASSALMPPLVSSSFSLPFPSASSLSGLGGSHGSLQDPAHMRANMLYSNCSGGLPNIILTDDSNPSLSKDISGALSTVPECFDAEGVFPLEDELRIEPLSLDGLSMLSDPDMVLPDPSVEDSFRSDRL
uniref:CREB regulated transcription coactivator 3 n=1 Tax=Tetraodon nigroviridis TaxID=99883 RepID=H3CWR9_TETNG